jgi:hypothetical protein
MASVQKDIHLGAPATDAWDALRDFGAVHQRVAPGFVVDTRLDGHDRLVTFAGGTVARERLVTVDDHRRRLVYTVVEGPLGATHHQASVEVLDDAGRGGSCGCRLVWTTDVLPDALASTIERLMDQGAAAIASAFGR